MNNNRGDIDIRKEHAIETYKSLITLSTESFKLLFILNGGAVIALLSFVGNARSKCLWVPDMSISIGFYLAGLASSSLLLLVSYHTQLTLYNETDCHPLHLRFKVGSHEKPLRWGYGLFIFSIICFLIGSSIGLYFFS